MQRRMLGLLADGFDHSRRELHGCLVDELGPPANVNVHINTMRPKLRRFGLDLITMRVVPEGSYRLVRLVADSGTRSG